MNVTHCLGLINFYTYDSANFKSIGNNTMKNAIKLLRWPRLLQVMCSTDVYCSKQTGSSSTKGNHHPSFLRFTMKKIRLMQPKFVAAASLKTETQQTFVNGLLGFITLGIYTPAGSACVLPLQ